MSVHSSHFGTGKISRRTLLQGVGAAAAVGIARPAMAASQTIKIGYVMPMTGPLAIFSEHVPFVLEQIKKATGGQLDIGGRKVAVEILLRDSQSNPNRAAEVASDLILNSDVNLILAAATPETTVPVADQAELNGVPCLTNDTPIEPYFFGRKGDPKVGFKWTNHYFFSGNQVANEILTMFDQVSSSRVIGVLWANDGDGNAFAKFYPELFASKKFKISDPGRFDMPMASYSGPISRFKADNAELIYGLTPPPEFTTFFGEIAQQNFKPKLIYVGKTTEFPQPLNAFGARAEKLITEVWWAPVYPYVSTLTKQSAQELADEYEKASGKQWSMPLGFRHSIFEVAFDALKRTQDISSAQSIQDALNATDLTTICGPINFKKGPFPNTATTPTAGGQWVKGKKFPLDLRICSNGSAPDVKVEGKAEAMS